MSLGELKIKEAEQAYNLYCETKQFTCDPENQKLRNEIASKFDATLKELNITTDDISNGNNAYRVDYKFGLKLYDLLSNKYNVHERQASDDNMWRWLTMSVVPDIVDKRFDAASHPDRFWKKGNRIWLRSEWWYIHLSWQGDIQKTEKVICNNSTDEIAQLVDRVGRTGYRVSLYREIMKKYGGLSKTERADHIFRKTMKLNTARSQAIEPGLVAGGEKQYVEDLYNHFKD